MVKIPTCHPNLKHLALGLCGKCYRIKSKDRLKSWIEKNRQRSNEIKRNWRNNNIDKVRVIESLSRKANRSSRCANTQRYRYAKKIRTPSWADKIAIKCFYDNCPKGLTVDHIIPFRGEIVSGLHVENNLQYLTVEQNARKHNKCFT